MRYEQKKGFRRTVRVGETLREVIAETIERRVDDPRVGFVTVTGVDAAPDLRTARVSVSVYDNPDHEADALAALNEAAPMIQREVARHVRIKWTPSLTFVLDHTPAQADRIERLLSDEPDRTVGEE